IQGGAELLLNYRREKNLHIQQSSTQNKLYSSVEGSTVTLSYKYTTGATYFFWYRQHPGKTPELLISHSPSGSVGEKKVPGLKIQVEGTEIKMSISSAAVTDSAVYYCAVRPTVTGNTKTLLLLLLTAETCLTPAVNIRPLTSDGFIFSSFPGLTAGDSITPQQTEVTKIEGKSVKLRCNYETDDSYVWLHWYKHHSDLQAPQFILRKGAKGNLGEYIPDKRYDSETSPTSTTLTITALTLADTALYYCALETQ
uniref:Ig-like domain-containing protein n=1 Tax=Oreochromis aureus TaxID=47969 RepID=A0AAZ1XFD7_OREAU